MVTFIRCENIDCIDNGNTKKCLRLTLKMSNNGYCIDYISKEGIIKC